MSTKENNKGMFGFTTTEKDGKVKKHLYPTAAQAEKARAAFIRHACCRTGSKNKTLTYEVYDFKTEKQKEITVSAPTYKIGPGKLF